MGKTSIFEDTSSGNKIKSKTQSKYVPKKHLQVDIVSISDDEYENVDSASDFSEDEQELENISSSSEKFGSARLLQPFMK
jgi:hypothetical protein